MAKTKTELYKEKVVKINGKSVKLNYVVDAKPRTISQAAKEMVRLLGARSPRCIAK